MRGASEGIVSASNFFTSSLGTSPLTVFRITRDEVVDCWVVAFEVYSEGVV
jgi:hypothetical protein